MATRLSPDEDNEPRFREALPFWICIVAWIIGLIVGGLFFYWLKNFTH